MIWLPLALGYLLGSFLPAYFLTKWITGVDVRTVGTHHAGTTNVYRVAGFAPAMVTAVYDLLKGILAVFISNSLGYPEWVSYLSGLCAILGHVFPFYLSFRGGKGAATTVGLLLMSLWKLGRWILLRDLLVDILVLLLLVLVLLYTARKGDVIGIFVLPALALLMAVRIEFSKVWFMDILISILLLINLKNISELRLFKFKEDVCAWRIYIRPVSLALFCLSFFMSRSGFLTLTGTLLLIFVIPDVIRLTSEKVQRFFHKRVTFKIYKDEEKSKISSMSLFLLGVFVTFLLFEKRIAFLSTVFLAFGDLAAKVVGISFGKKKLFEKTIEGSLAHFVVCFYSAYLVSCLNLVDFPIGVAGALAATITELLPMGVNDNLSVPFFSALVMSLWKLL